MSGGRVAIAGSELVFDCAPGQTVLDAALAAGIELPHSCRKGVCGNCAAPVTVGAVARCGPAAITHDAIPDGQVLLCAAAPVGDVTIAPARWSRLDPSACRRFGTRVFRNEALAPDVTLLQLRLPAGQRAKFRAGQYLRLRMADGDSRCYSMANAPHESDTLTLHVRRLPGGRFSDAVLPTLAKGAQVDVELPFGSVALDHAGDRPIVFVAGGTGFAPVKSILDDFARRGVVRPVTLVWGARSAPGLYALGALAPWRRKLPGFRFVPVLDEPAAGGLPDTVVEPVFAGRPDQALAALGDLSAAEVYCCGAPAMVDAVRAAAAGAGVGPTAFHADVFVDSNT